MPTEDTQSSQEPFSKKQRESHLRSVLKGITWRILGTIDTMVISWFMTGSIKIAAAIGGTEVITKIVLYYIHERAWQMAPTARVWSIYRTWNRLLSKNKSRD